MYQHEHPGAVTEVSSSVPCSTHIQTLSYDSYNNALATVTLSNKDSKDDPKVSSAIPLTVLCSPRFAGAAGRAGHAGHSTTGSNINPPHPLPHVFTGTNRSLQAWSKLWGPHYQRKFLNNISRFFISSHNSLEGVMSKLSIF